jgi:hypothetical protein
LQPHAIKVQQDPPGLLQGKNLQLHVQDSLKEAMRIVDVEIDGNGGNSGNGDIDTKISAGIKTSAGIRTTADTTDSCKKARLLETRLLVGIMIEIPGFQDAYEELAIHYSVDVTISEPFIRWLKTLGGRAEEVLEALGFGSDDQDGYGDESWPLNDTKLPIENNTETPSKKVAKGTGFTFRDDCHYDRVADQILETNDSM